MPTQPEHHESPEIQSVQDDRMSFSLADFTPADQWDTAASPPPRQPYSEMAHDWEASGSRTQADYESQFVASIFHTPTPPPATDVASDPWDTALTMSRQDSLEPDITPARAVQAGQPQWEDWHERIFSRENRGIPPHRFSPSQYDG